MKKSFHASKAGFDICLEKDGVNFFAKTQKISDKIAKIKGKIAGKTLHTCDRCGDEFILNLDENVEVLASDGLFEGLEKEKLDNIIEFFDGFIDFDEIFVSELEAIKSDYFYCKKCTN
ncbi:MAG: hypothetical protein CR967_01170 [Proteobacteria bacterium]|nr:MAG: hypothetical protein CR967_01170 [Pseudomonadota bacterium]